MTFWYDVYAPYLTRQHTSVTLPPTETIVAITGNGIMQSNNHHDKLVAVKNVTSQMSDLAIVDSRGAENGEQNGSSNLVESVKKEEEKCCS